MSATLPPQIRFQPFAVNPLNGLLGPIPGGTVYFYAAGTLTPQNVYADDGTTSVGNVLTLDANGATDFRLGAGLSYKVDLKDSTGAGVAGWPRDNVQDIAGLAVMAADLASPATGKGASLVGYLAPFTGAVGTTQQQVNSERVSVFRWFTPAQIADVTSGAMTLDVSGAVSAAIAACKRLYFPPGKYRFNSGWTISGVNGCVIEGATAALMTSGTSYLDNTIFNFDNVGTGLDGLTITSFVGLTMKNIVISNHRAAGGGGKALYLYNGHDFILENIKVDSQTGATGKGIVLGGGTGATSVVIGELRNCKVISQGGASFESNPTNTSLTFIGCYQIGGYYSLNSTIYSTFISCASEVSPGFGWVLTGCESLTFNSCAGEANAKGVFKLVSTCLNIIFNTPYGGGNNTSADATIGDLIHMDSSSGVIESITIVNPACPTSDAATVQNIYGGAGSGVVEVHGVSVNRLPRGVGGDAAWVKNQLTITGDGEVTTWAPTLVGWTNTGTPTVVGKYVKRGKVVSFYVLVTPGTNISATLLTSTITGLPYTPVGGVASMVDGNGRSLGSVSVSSSGTIYPQTTGVITVPVTISGQFII